MKNNTLISFKNRVSSLLVLPKKDWLVARDKLFPTTTYDESKWKRVIDEALAKKPDSRANTPFWIYAEYFELTEEQRDRYDYLRKKRNTYLFDMFHSFSDMYLRPTEDGIPTFFHVVEQKWVARIDLSKDKLELSSRYFEDTKEVKGVASFALAMILDTYYKLIKPDDIYGSSNLINLKTDVVDTFYTFCLQE